MKLAELVSIIGGDGSQLGPALSQENVHDVVIDSREVKAGDVFFALSQPEYKDNGFNGDFDDATVYAAGALEKGVIACVLRRDRYNEHRTDLERYASRLIFVDDCIAALQSLAHGIYEQWNGPVVAVTGSAGKTTAKELTAHVLASSGRKVLKNIKNYNNGLGHPLTVLNLLKDPTYDVAVLEMGMSTPLHEIERLCRITPPDVSIVLNVLPVHIEHLGSIEGIADAKGEIVAGMKPTGTAILNADDERVAAMSSKTNGKIVTYGMRGNADVRAENVRHAGFGLTTFDLVIGDERSAVSFPLNGDHNIMNALAAAAAGHTFGMTTDAIAGAISSVAAPPQRGEIIRFADGITVINDSYNSNPDALISMVRTLVENAGDARKVVVAGEMLELGEMSDEAHSRCGRDIAAAGVDVLVGVRGSAKLIVDAAKAAGMSEAVFAEDSAAAGEVVSELVKSGDVILVKGSRGVRTEKVIEKLLTDLEQEEAGAAVV